MNAYYNSRSVALTWALDVAAQVYSERGGDPDELAGVASRALTGNPDGDDATDAREWLSDIVPGLEFFAH
jgi:hypothetical protein